MSQIEDQLTVAQAAVDHAQDVRAVHRRRSRRGSPERESAIKEARRRLREAMQPLREHQGRVSYAKRDLSDIDYDRIREVSRSMQAERRKLWKMAAH